MLYKELIELFDMLDSASASGSEVVEYFRSIDPMCQVETYPLEGPKGHTDMVRILIPEKTENQRAETLERSAFSDASAVWGQDRNRSGLSPTVTAH